MPATENRDWRQHAACASDNPHRAAAWFPAEGEVIDPGVLDTCAACPVRVECLGFALTHDVGHGVWAGLTGFELAHYRGRLRIGSALIELAPLVLAHAADRATSARPVTYNCAPVAADRPAVANPSSAA